MISGTEKFSPDKIDIMKAALKYNGIISNIAEHFQVSRETIYQYFKREPIGKEIIDFVRNYNTEVDLDTAEYVNRYNMSQYKTNPHLAQRAAEKVLDKKGAQRGWANKDEINMDQTIKVIDARSDSAPQIQVSPLPGSSMDSN